MYVPAKTPEIKRIIDAARVNGKRNGDVSIDEFRGPISMNSYWDGGSKDEFALVDLETLKTWSMPTSHPYFDRRPNGERCGNLELSELPPNVCLVEGGYFCGKPATLKIRLRSENMARLLPKPGPSVSKRALDALNTIAGIKSSYRAEEFRRAHLGTYGADNPYVKELKKAGYVKINKAGAISVTTAGRNAR